MQAIILAAGMGKRLGDLTANDTKCMVKMNNTPIIDRMILQLKKVGIKKIKIVVGYKRENIILHLKNTFPDTDIEFIHNAIYNKTNNIYSLFLAKEKLMEDDTILLESDLVFEDKLLEKIISDKNPNVALVAKYESWMDGTVVKLGYDNTIVSFISKNAFDYNEIDKYYKTVNIYKFSKAFSKNKYVPFLEAYCKSLGNNEYYEQVLKVIALLNDTELKGLPLNGEKWYEIDDIKDLNIAETIFADENNRLKKFYSRYGGYWRFPQMLDFCYLVNPYFPTKRMKLEMKASFETLLTEYPSGMYVNSLLAGRIFGIKNEYICVGNGAAELIKALMENFDCKIGLSIPTFEEYPNRKEEEDIIYFKPVNNSFSYTANDLIEYYNDKEIGMLLIINPDNPSGNFIPKVDLFKIYKWAEKKNICLVIDESFVDFSDNFESNTLLKNDILESCPSLIVIKSISKSYGVPGLRLGVIASSNQKLIQNMKQCVSIWNINSFAEFYMQIFSKYENDYKKACNKLIEERKRFIKRLSKINFIKVIPSQANYLLCEVTEPISSIKLTEELLNKYNILVKDCSTKKGFEGKNFIRIAIRDTKDNDKLIAAFKSIMNNNL